MGKHAEAMTRPPATNTAWGGGVRRPSAPGIERHVRVSWSLPLFASIVSLVFVLTAITDHSPAVGLETSAPAPQLEPQVVLAATADDSTIEPADWTITEPPPPAPTSGTAPAAGTPDPGSAQAIAYDMVAARGWGPEQFDCLVALWSKESGWNVYAHNKSSGAYGIPQSLPGSKMATAGADWATNPATQITWGLNYINGRYGAPCEAWAFSQRNNWY